MRFEYELSVEDLAELHRAINQLRALIKPILMVTALMALVASFFFCRYLRFTFDNIILLVSPCLVILWMVLAIRPDATRLKKELNPSLRGRHSADLSDKGLTWTSEVSRGEERWSGFVSYLETANLFVLFSSPDAARILPKRALQSEVEVEQVRSILASQIGFVHPKKRR